MLTQNSEESNTLLVALACIFRVIYVSSGVEMNIFTKA